MVLAPLPPLWLALVAGAWSCSHSCMSPDCTWYCSGRWPPWPQREGGQDGQSRPAALSNLRSAPPHPQINWIPTHQSKILGSPLVLLDRKRAHPLFQTRNVLGPPRSKVALRLQTRRRLQRQIGSAATRHGGWLLTCCMQQAPALPLDPAGTSKRQNNQLQQQQQHVWGYINESKPRRPSAVHLLT